MKVDLLVIGYGNELLGDDGVGPAVARAVQRWRHPRICAIAAHQLTPELVEAIADAERVVFVDARLSTGEFMVERVTPTTGANGGHTSDPGWLMGLAERCLRTRRAGVAGDHPRCRPWTDSRAVGGGNSGQVVGPGVDRRDSESILRWRTVRAPHT